MDIYLVNRKNPSATIHTNHPSQIQSYLLGRDVTNFLICVEGHETLIPDANTRKTYMKLLEWQHQEVVDEYLQQEADAGLL